MRKVTADERALFLAALSGRLPAKTVRAVVQAMAKKAAEQAPSETKPSVDKTNPGRRRASDEEVLLFLEAIGLRASPAPVVTAPKPQPAKAPTKPVVKLPSKAPPQTGLDGNTKKKLEKGDLAPDAKLDLHGLTESAAHGSLLRFLQSAHRRGDRLVLIVTGKGEPAKAPFERGRGILKQMVPRWLEEAPMVKIIADKRWAHRRHGGEGALYVYLRKTARG